LKIGPLVISQEDTLRGCRLAERSVKFKISRDVMIMKLSPWVW